MGRELILLGIFCFVFSSGLVSAVNINSCQDLSADTYYDLTQNVGADTICMNITGNGVVLDCNNYLINFATTGTGYGINNSNGYDNITIKNCKINQTNISTPGYHIFLNNSDNSTIEYSNMTNGRVGVLAIDSFNLTIHHNFAYEFLYGEANDWASCSPFYTGDSSQYFESGIWIIRSNNATIYNNTLKGNESQQGWTNHGGMEAGITLCSSNYSNLTSNNIFYMDTFGFLLTGCEYTGVFYNFVNGSNNMGDTNTNDGIITSSAGGDKDSARSHYTTIMHNKFYKSNEWGIFLGNTNFSTVYNNTASFGGVGIRIGGWSSYNNITRNNMEDNGEGMRLEGNHNIINENNISTSVINARGIRFRQYGGGWNLNNTITNNTIISTGFTSYGFYMNNNGTNNTIKNNTITTSGDQAYGIYFNSYIDKGNNWDNVRINSSSAQAIFVDGTLIDHYNISVDEDNLAEGKAINYTFNSQDIVYDGSVDSTLNDKGQIICGWCERVTFQSISLSDSDGICLYNALNSTVKNSNMIDNKGYGIFLYPTSTYTILENNNITSSEAYCDGIRLYGGYNNITNNSIVTSGNYSDGIYTSTAIESDNNRFINNTITMSGYDTDGIYIPGSSDDNLFVNNTITVSGNDSIGIYFRSGSSNSLMNNSIILYANNIHGIYFRVCTSCEATNNNLAVSGNDSHGIYFQGGSSTNVANNSITIPGNNSFGISFVGSSSNTLKNNNISCTGKINSGIYFDGGYNNKIINNSISASGPDSYGLYFNDRSYGNQVEGPAMINTTSWPIYLIFSDNNTFKDLGDVEYIKFKGSKNNNFSNINLTKQSNITFVNYVNRSNANNLFLNVSFNQTNVSFSDNTEYGECLGGTRQSILCMTQGTQLLCEAQQGCSWEIGWGCQGLPDPCYYFGSQSFCSTQTDCSWTDSIKEPLYVQWYMDVFVNYSNGSIASGASVKAYDTNNALKFTDTTETNGYISRQNVTEFYENATQKYYYTNYSVNATKNNNISETEQVNLTGNLIDEDNVTLTINLINDSGNGGDEGAGGGGGGGGSVGTGEVKEHCWASLDVGEEVIMNINNKEIGVEKISFTVKTDLTGPSTKCLEVAQVRNVSATGVNEYENKDDVYKYFILTATGITNSDIENLKIEISVVKSWLEDRVVDDLALHRYSAGWNKLDTLLLESEESYEYFEAASPGFSEFAVIAPKLEEAEEQEEQEVIIEKKISWWAWLIIGVIALILAYFVYSIVSSKKKKNKGFSFR